MEKKVIDRRFRKKKDEANILLHFDDLNARDTIWWFAQLLIGKWLYEL